MQGASVCRAHAEAGPQAVAVGKCRPPATTAVTRLAQTPLCGLRAETGGIPFPRAGRVTSSLALEAVAL